MSEAELQLAYLAWRMHLWHNNVGSYEDIERMVFTDKEIKIGQCPTEGCNCPYEKVQVAP